MTCSLYVVLDLHVSGHCPAPQPPPPAPPPRKKKSPVAKNLLIRFFARKKGRQSSSRKKLSQVFLQKERKEIRSVQNIYKRYIYCVHFFCWKEKTEEINDQPCYQMEQSTFIDRFRRIMLSLRLKKTKKPPAVPQAHRELFTLLLLLSMLM